MRWGRKVSARWRRPKLIASNRYEVSKTLSANQLAQTRGGVSSLEAERPKSNPTQRGGEEK